MYIVKDDYKNRLSSDLLNLIISESGDNGDTILSTVSKIAEDTINATAGMLYDFTEEFAFVTTARNYLIVSLALSICVYEVYQRIPDESIPEKVIKNYDDAMNDLKDCAKGKFPLKLPAAVVVVPDTTGQAAEGETVSAEGGGTRRISSLPKRSHRL